jgi:hypothetical protein
VLTVAVDEWEEDNDRKHLNFVLDLVKNPKHNIGITDRDLLVICQKAAFLAFYPAEVGSFDPKWRVDEPARTLQRVLFNNDPVKAARFSASLAFYLIERREKQNEVR